MAVVRVIAGVTRSESQNHKHQIETVAYRPTGTESEGEAPQPGGDWGSESDGDDARPGGARPEDRSSSKIAAADVG
eukprot:CAMPEP_0185554200 /NCGR_PEP_ID=MMETSP1381-20130426/40449_1 /TAXON_ID=298111 /ORGANISM="Pavlova sp., Strain CCMP459" /LENGTH=75 /DNA_ID=CAMNT_0028167387 /DNA_START=51 /DNA_END=274 /DNA_ORIENTATION=+